MEKINYVNSSFYKVEQISEERKCKLKRETEDKFYGAHILGFISTLEKDPNIDLSLFYNNLDSISFRNDDPSFQKRKKRNRKLIAAYYPYANKICFDSMSMDADIYHEEFHMASCKVIRDAGIWFGGLRQETLDRKIKIGSWLNEGYTELCVERYFPEAYDEKILKTYLTEKHMAMIIEEIVGKKIMQDSYFQADLNKLIKYLSLFNKEENVINFLINDKILKFHTLNKQKNYFLIEIYVQKLVDDYCTRKISYDELVSKLSKYFYLFGIKCLDRKCKDILGRNITSSIIEQQEIIKKEKAKELILAKSR